MEIQNLVHRWGVSTATCRGGLASGLPSLRSGEKKGVQTADVLITYFLNAFPVCGSVLGTLHAVVHLSVLENNKGTTDRNKRQSNA